jgi:hypothetical protein
MVLATRLSPTSNLAEMHLSYKCNLACKGCNRFVFLSQQHTPDMTVADAEEFFRQAEALDWHPKIALIGGEPTLNKDIFAIIDVIAEHSPFPAWLLSNGYSDETKRILDRLRREGKTHVEEGTIKHHGSVVHTSLGMCLAPKDSGQPFSFPCRYHSHGECGVSVDACGYTGCPVGGAIDGCLRLGVRTNRLADLWDDDFMAMQSEAICSCCGLASGERECPGAEMRHGIMMSPTWLKAIDRR